MRCNTLKVFRAFDIDVSAEVFIVGPCYGAWLSPSGFSKVSGYSYSYFPGAANPLEYGVMDNYVYKKRVDVPAGQTSHIELGGTGTRGVYAVVIKWIYPVTGTTTTYLTPEADVFVKPGDSPRDGVENICMKYPYTDTVSERVSYIRFDISSLQGQKIKTAKLRLYGYGKLAEKPVIIELSEIQDNWDENTIVWDTRLAKGQVFEAREAKGYSAAPAWTEFNIERYLSQRIKEGNNKLSFALTVPFDTYSDNDRFALFNSKEAGSNKPELVVETVSLGFMGKKSELTDIAVEGVSVPGFDPEIYEYSVSLNNLFLTRTPYIIAYASDGALANINIEYPQGVPVQGESYTAVIHVVSENGLNEKTYTINYTQ